MFRLISKITGKDLLKNKRFIPVNLSEPWIELRDNITYLCIDADVFNRVDVDWNAGFKHQYDLNIIEFDDSYVAIPILDALKDEDEILKSVINDGGSVDSDRVNLISELIQTVEKYSNREIINK